MKILFLFICFLSFESGINAQNTSYDLTGLSEKGRTAFSKLLSSTTVFAVGGVGPGGQRSVGETALIELLQEPGCDNALVFLTANATTAGSLYGLFGLKFKNKCLYEKQLLLVKARFASDEVVFGSGCSIEKVDVAQLIRAIESDAFDSRFVFWKKEIRNR